MDYWLVPEPVLFVQSMLLNLLPGLVAWVMVVHIVATMLSKPKGWLFQLVILGLVLTNIPTTSMFWFYRELDNPLHPLRNVQVWGRLIYCSVLTMVFLFSLFWVMERRRVGKWLISTGRRHAKPFKVANHPVAGRLILAIKITLGRTLIIALFGVTLLAVLLVNPIGLLKDQPI